MLILIKFIIGWVLFIMLFILAILYRICIWDWSDSLFFKDTSKNIIPIGFSVFVGTSTLRAMGFTDLE
jgi:hypothetical protein